MMYISLGWLAGMLSLTRSSLMGFSNLRYEQLRCLWDLNGFNWALTIQSCDYPISDAGTGASDITVCVTTLDQ